jgi:hypothetical protein
VYHLISIILVYLDNPNGLQKNKIQKYGDKASPSLQNIPNRKYDKQMLDHKNRTIGFI